MDVVDRNASPASSSSTTSSAVGQPCRRRHFRQHSDEEEEEDGGDPSSSACTGKRCQSCTAGVIADCVAVSCCPCAVVNFFTLAFVKLPWAVARRCIRRRKRKSRRRRRMMLEDGISSSSGKRRVEEGTSEIVLALDELNDHFGAEFYKAEDVWLEVGHLGFGRVSFTGNGIPPFHNKAD